MIHARPIMARFQQIVRVLADGKVHTSTQLAASLEVHHKTVMRDLEHMRDRLSVPIQSIQGRGYQITGKVTLCDACLRPVKRGKA